MILILGIGFLNGFSVTLQKNIEKINPKQTGISEYFTLVYTGIGVDHMNINLVNLKLTGLEVGDEIGVFDGKYCVGKAIIEEKHIQDNGISIASSANDTIENSPNGYIDGHKIILKACRNGTVYMLYFQAVNGTKDIFERWESMFALVDFSKSTGYVLHESQNEIKLYPNPFDRFIKIEINLLKKQYLKCEVLDMNGRLVKTLYKGYCEGQTHLMWDGSDNNNNKVNSGVYVLQSNFIISKMIYKGATFSK